MSPRSIDLELRTIVYRLLISSYEDFDFHGDYYFYDAEKSYERYAAHGGCFYLVKQLTIFLLVFGFYIFLNFFLFNLLCNIFTVICTEFYLVCRCHRLKFY